MLKYANVRTSKRFCEVLVICNHIMKHWTENKINVPQVYQFNLFCTILMLQTLVCWLLYGYVYLCANFVFTQISIELDLHMNGIMFGQSGNINASMN